MKFASEASSEDKVVVAFIDADGDLQILVSDEVVILFSNEGTRVLTGRDLIDQIKEYWVRKKFYRGDTPKITFRGHSGYRKSTWLDLGRDYGAGG